MDDKTLHDAGYRSQFEYYDKLEATYRKMAEDMHQKKMQALTEWKQGKKLREAEDL